MVEYSMEQLDSTFFALSSSTRRTIIARLSSKGPTRVTEIAEPFDMSLNAISKHLKVLESAGLISRIKEGRTHIIKCETEPLKDVAKWVHPYEKFWSHHLDNLENHFKFKKKGKTK
jgi:DNA-binding transcriptional ArsR family regulator